MARSKEVFWWSLFSAGGVMSALFIPALIIAVAFCMPTDSAIDAATRHNHLLGVFDGFLGLILKLVLFGVLFLTLFHCAHRIRHTAEELGLRSLKPVLAIVCYGGALVGTVFAAYIIFTLPGAMPAA